MIRCLVGMLAGWLQDVYKAAVPINHIMTLQWRSNERYPLLSLMPPDET